MTKRKKSKKKVSKDEDETTRSEINLLTASTDPKVDDEDDSDDPDREQPELPLEEKKSSKKTIRKGSDSSVKDPLADSHSSLKDYFPDQALKNYLQGLHVNQNI